MDPRWLSRNSVRTQKNGMRIAKTISHQSVHEFEAAIDGADCADMND